MIPIFVLIFCLLFPSLSFATPQIWQATKGELTFTIMGSIHAGKQSFYPLPPLIDKRLHRADALIVEVDLINDIDITLPDSRPTRTLITDTQKKALDIIAQEINVPLPSLLNMPPWQTALSLQIAQTTLAQLDSDFGVDLYFLRQSHHSNIPVISLETVQQQLELLTHAGQDGITFLSETLTDWALAKEVTPCLIQAWEQGDGQKLTAIVTAQNRNNNGFTEKLLADRNHQWLAILTNFQRVPAGDYVVVVGALHLYGQQGLLNLLKENGFSVTLLTHAQNANCQLPDLSPKSNSALRP